MKHVRFYDDHDEADHAAVQVPVQPAPSSVRRADSTTPATELEIARLIERQGGNAESPGGTIEATVDATGRITNIRLDPRLSALPLDQLADHIATTCSDAFNQRLDAIAQLDRLVLQQRLEELQQQQRDSGLDADGKQEMRELLQAQRR